MHKLGLIAVAFPFLMLAGCSGEPDSSNGQSDSSSATDTAAREPAEPDPSASPTPADSSRLSLDWLGTYSGVVPCASCPGIETKVTLNADQSFELSMRYIDENPIPITMSGRFEWNDAGSKIRLTDDNGEVRRYQVGEHRLFMLDQEGNRIEGELAPAYILDQHVHDAAIEDRRWVLIELRGQAIELDEDQREAFLTLRSEDSRLHGNSSCNTFNGSYAIKTGQRIEFGDNIAMTMMACPDMTIENQFMEVLKMVDNYSLGEDGTMTLNRARMAPLARFVEGQEAD